MISDWNTRNRSSLVLRGLRDRFSRAKFGREMIFILGAMWDAANLPLERP